MADVLLIVPRKNYDKDLKQFKRMEIFPPTGILFLGGALKKEGISVKLLDTYALGLSLDEAMDRIQRERPTIIGIAAFSDFIQGTVQLADAIRKSGMRSVLAVGGPHVSAVPEFYNQFPLFDLAFVGETEISFTNAAKDILNGKAVRGVLKSERIQDLDLLPMPDRDLIDDELRQSYYSGGCVGFEKTNVHSSRGCPYSCIFCSNYYKKVRFHSPERVINEVELCVKKYGSKVVAFTDDNFTLDKDRVFRICDLFHKKNINIGWGSVVRADSLNRDLLKAMKSAGCIGVTVGVETGNEAMRLKVLKKGIKDKDVLNAKRWCDELGMLSSFFFMAGFPGETMKELNETLDFARKLETVFFANSMTICYPGTEIWDIAVKEKKYPADYWQRFAAGKEDKLPLYYPDGFDRDGFLELTKRFVYKYYLDPRYFVIALKFSLRSYSNFKSMAFYCFEFFKHLFKKFVLKRTAIMR